MDRVYVSNGFTCNILLYYSFSNKKRLIRIIVLILVTMNRDINQPKRLTKSVNSHWFIAIQIGRIQSIERSKDGRQQK